MVIYQVTNKINGMIYIGKTIQNPEHRINAHVSEAKRGSNTYFHRAMRKYGLENFEWDVLLDLNNKHIKDYSSLYIESSNGEKYKFPDKNLGEIEKAFISMYKKWGYNLYNLTDGGEGTTGYHPSEETRKKLSESHRGRIVSDETKQKLREKALGRILSEETKEKLKNRVISEENRKKMTEGRKMKGYKHSPEIVAKIIETRRKNGNNKMSEYNKEKLRESKLGVPRSEETRRKLSEAQKGRKQSENAKRKRSESLKNNKNSLGYRHSDESKNKMSESAKRRWEHEKLLRITNDRGQSI